MQKPQNSTLGTFFCIADNIQLLSLYMQATFDSKTTRLMIKYTSLIFLFVCLTTAGYGQQLGLQSLAQLQESPAGNKLIQFFQAVNTQTSFSKKDVHQHFSIGLIEKLGEDQLFGIFDDIRTNDGQIELYEINRISGTSYQLKGKGTKHGEWLNIGISMDEHPPHKINGLQGIETTDSGPKVDSPILRADQIIKTGKSKTGSSKLPETPAGKRMEEFIQALEEGTYEAYLKNEFAPSFFELIAFREALEMTAEIAEESHGYWIHSLVENTPYEIEILAQPKADGGWQHLILKTESEAPHKIAIVGIEPADPPADIAANLNNLLVKKTLESPHPRGKEWIQGQLGKQLDDYLTTQFQNGYSGAALVIKKGEKILYKGYGLADRTQAIPNTTNTFFDLGSIMKDFTDAAILKLESEGHLSTEDPISKFLPRVPKDKQAITIHQLLWHASGLSSDHSPYDDTEMSKQEALEAIYRASLHFEPGTDRLYSNSGFTVLAAIIERVSGRPYLDYIEQEIIQAAGLEGWAYFGQGERMQKHQAAIGYDGLNRGNYNNPYLRRLPNWQILGAGGICMSLEELYHFSMAIKTGKVIPEDAVKKFMEIYNPAPAKKFGTPVRFFGGGSDVGFTAICLDFPEEEAYVIIASNTARFANPTLADPLAKMLLGQELEADQHIPFVAKTTKDWGLPTSAAGHQAAAFLNALCSDDRSIHESYVKEAYAPDFYSGYPEIEHINFLGILYKDLDREPELSKIKVINPTTIEFYMDSSKTGSSIKVFMQTEEAAPNRIVDLSVGE